MRQSFLVLEINFGDPVCLWHWRTTGDPELKNMQHTFRGICYSYEFVSKKVFRENNVTVVKTRPISTAPAVEPAIIERNALGLSLGFSG